MCVIYKIKLGIEKCLKKNILIFFINSLFQKRQQFVVVDVSKLDFSNMEKMNPQIFYFYGRNAKQIKDNTVTITFIIN